MKESIIKGFGVGIGIFLIEKIYEKFQNKSHKFFYGNFETMEDAGKALTDMHFKFEEQGYLTVTQFYDLCRLKDLGNISWGHHGDRAWDSLVGFKVAQSRYDGRWGIKATSPKFIF